MNTKLAVQPYLSQMSRTDPLRTVGFSQKALGRSTFSRKEDKGTKAKHNVAAA